MTVRKSGASAPAIPGAQALAAVQEFVAMPGFGSTNVTDPSGAAAWAGVTVGRYAEVVAAWTRMNVQVISEDGNGGGPMLRLRNTAVAAAQLVFSPPSTNAAAGAGFRHLFSDALEPATVPAELSQSVSAWIAGPRGLAGETGGLTPFTARHFFGFASVIIPPAFSRRIVRIGLTGNGGTGFRFGSVNCPAAVAGAVENGNADINANSVAPTILAAPGGRWFHVRVKMLTANAVTPGRFACYLNGRRVAVFDLPENMPRSSRNNVDGAGPAFWPLCPVVSVWPDPAGAAAFPVLYLRDLRVRIEQDDTL